MEETLVTSQTLQASARIILPVKNIFLMIVKQSKVILFDPLLY